jgi:glycine/D-amino acid oxidase-like deaminating enzyme
MKKIKDVEIAIIGTGIVGIATAYYLCKKYQRSSVMLIDSRDPMSYTTAQSGDNYRNWWPSQLMAQFTNHSIGLMHDLARETSNVLQMKQRGYALATRRKNVDDLLEALELNYKGSDGLVRIHTNSISSTYKSPLNNDWASVIDGVDVVSNKKLIHDTFPAFDAQIEHVLHIRKAGDFSSQQMGAYMLEQVKPLGCSRLRGQVKSIVKNERYTLELNTQDGNISLKADMVVNAAGPFVGEVAKMLDSELPVENVFHQKIAFEDTRHAVPRNQPFTIDLDEANLYWANEERAALSEDPTLSWLTKPIEGGIHCRPEGTGRWIKLGWAYNRHPSQPDNNQPLANDPAYDPSFPEVVIRGAALLNPKLSPYIDELPKGRIHYGGYYTMTKENWPIVGPLKNQGSFVAGALSGFGSMGSCAAGALCADWICGGDLPDYARALSLSRYDDPTLVDEMSRSNIGLL